MNQARLDTLSAAARTRVLRHSAGPARALSRYNFHMKRRQQAFREYTKARTTPGLAHDDLDWLAARLGWAAKSPAERMRENCLRWQRLALEALQVMPARRLP